MDSNRFKLDRRGILPGFAEGRFESGPTYSLAEFANTHLEDPLRRDHRTSIRVSGNDMGELHRQALAEGVPLQSLLAQIVHLYATGQLEKAATAIKAEQAPA
ncbi:MAG: hypothetical protein RLZZ227_741, partial [Pseudomonadota bacterium]